MLVEILEEIPTRRGSLMPGQMVDLPDEVAEKLGGKVRPGLPFGVIMADIEAEFSVDLRWSKMKSDHQWLHHMAEALHFRRLREQGKVPPSYKATVVCKECGPVFLEPWTPPFVEGCPWCMSRAKGLPVPIPSLTLDHRHQGGEP